MQPVTDSTNCKLKIKDSFLYSRVFEFFQYFTLILRVITVLYRSSLSLITFINTLYMLGVILIERLFLSFTSSMPLYVIVSANRLFLLALTKIKNKSSLSLETTNRVILIFVCHHQGTKNPICLFRTWRCDVAEHKNKSK